MRPYKDLRGPPYGSLTALFRLAEDHRKWRCRCVCGNLTDVFSGNLLRGNSTTCGCGRKAAVEKSNTSHGGNRRGARTAEYRIWLHMKTRCYNKHCYSYADYGGRGINICKAWKNDFAAFLKDMGPRPTPEHSIERKNNNRGYSPANCVWGTRKQQARNRRSVGTLTIDGVKRTIVEWGELSGNKTETIKHRLHAGRKPKDAVFSKVRW